MSGKAVELGPRFAPVDVAWLDAANHVGQDPLSQPGLIVVDGGDPYAVKSFRWRPVGAAPNGGVYASDVMRLTNTVQAGDAYVAGEAGYMGLEDESSAVEVASGQPANLYQSPGKDLRAALDEHPELFNSTLEVDVGPFTSMGEAYHGLGRRLFQAMQLLPAGVLLDPAAARMQDIPGPEAVSPNPYVLMKHREYADDGILTFIGHGIHEHHDAHVQYLPVIAKYVRPVAYLLNAGLSAAPFGFGELTPNLRDRLDNDELKPFDGVQPHSVRYPARLLAENEGGHQGGVGFGVVHSDLDSLLSYADRLLRDGQIDMAARVYGPYADVRVRVDPPAPTRLDHPGRLELCVKDTAAQRMETLWAYGELSAAVIRQLERVAAGGERAVARLHQEFPQLFGTTADDERFADNQLARAHANSLRHAYYGNDARVINGVGEEVTIQVQMRELLRFVAQDGQPLPAAATSIIRDSLMTTEQTEQVMLAHRDSEGLPSLSGYYATGSGSAAQWMIRHAAVLSDRGNSEEEVMRMATQDRARSCAAYLTNLCARN